MYGMKEGSEKVFGKGYNVLPIWKQRLNAKTLVTTPNSDVIYAMGYLDLKQDGPLVIEVPPGLQCLSSQLRCTHCVFPGIWVDWLCACVVAFI